MGTHELNADYWSNRYKSGEAGWDLGEISTPLKAFVDTTENKSLSILIPGAGNSYEGEYLLKNGFTNVTVLDYAPEALDGFRKRVTQHKNAHLVCEDFFAHQGKYDLILEQTFFCALDPSLRTAYARKMYELLKPAGRLVGLLFTEVPNAEGPPFGGNLSEYQNLFSKDFVIEKLEPCYNSIKPRAGRELFFKLLRK